MTAVVVAGCGSGASTGDSSGESITMGITDKISSVDPAAGYDVGSWIVFNNVFQSLLSFPDGATKPVPDAAKSCQFSGGNSKTYSCTLRSGLKFSNGDNLTSADVKYSFERTIKINDPNGPASSLLGSIKTIDTPSADKVVFHLKYSDATFPMKLGSAAGSIVDHTQYKMDALRTDGKAVGSGPYTLSSYEKDKQAVFKANGGYSGTAQPKNAGVTMRFYNDEDALKKDVTDGTVDFAYRGLATADIAKIQDASASGKGELEVIEGSGAEVQHLVFNMDDPVTGNKAVRQAIAYIIDRQTMIRDVYKRTVTPLYSIVPAGLTGHSTAFFDRYGEGGDTTKAKATLAAAGLTGKVSFTLWATPVRYGTGTVAELKTIAQQLNATGLFDITVKTVDADTYAKNIEAGKYAAYVKGWVPDYPDPDNFTAPFFGKGNVLFNHYTNSRITGDLIPATAAESDRSAAVPDFKEIQSIVAEDVPIIPLWQGKQYAVAQNDVTGLEWSLDPAAVFRFWEIEKTA
jgi:peptide/nickel transport system substrate-binding protein